MIVAHKENVMKKIIAIGLATALLLSSTSAFAFHRKPKAHLDYTPEHVLVVRKADQSLIYIPIVTPLLDEVVRPVINGVVVGIISGSTVLFGGVEYVLTNLTKPPRSCVARDSSLYSC
jgi:hypothetical protein